MIYKKRTLTRAHTHITRNRREHRKYIYIGVGGVLGGKGGNFLPLTHLGSTFYWYCTAQGPLGPLGPWTSTIRYGPLFQPLCLKLDLRPAEVMGLGSMPQCLTRGPLGMQSWIVHFLVHNQRPAQPTRLSWERDCSRIPYLNCLVMT